MEAVQGRVKIERIERCLTKCIPMSDFTFGLYDAGKSCNLPFSRYVYFVSIMF